MEEENPIISMARTGKIIRRSIYTFLQHYQYFTSISTLIALPFSISLLISQSFIVPGSHSLLDWIHTRIHSVFDAAGFPLSSGFFTLITLKFSQTISTSILTFPFAITFLLLAKASILNFLKTQFQKYPYKQNSHNKDSIFNLFSPLLSTHIWTSFLIFSANATSICLIFLASAFVEGTLLASPKWALLLSAAGAVFYSIVLANALVISSLALVSSSPGRAGFVAILRACGLIRGRTSTALALAVPINLGLAAVEALFHFRLVASSYDHDHSHTQLWALALEGLLIGYLYSILIVLDVIMSFFFYQSCSRKEQTGFISIHPDYQIHDHNVDKFIGLEEYV